MDFDLSEDQRELEGLATGLLAREASRERLEAHERSGAAFDAALWKAMAQAGLLGAVLPESAGGAGLGAVELAVLLRAVGRHVAPAPVYATLALGAVTLARHGTPEQQALLTAVAAGETVLTGAVREPGGGALWTTAGASRKPTTVGDGGQESGPLETTTQGTTAKNTAALKAANQGGVGQEIRTQGTAAQEGSAQRTAANGGRAQETADQEVSAQGTAGQGVRAQGTAGQEARAQGTADQEGRAQEVTSMGSAALKTPVPGNAALDLPALQAAALQAAALETAALETTARRDGDGWILDGVKTFVPFASVASYILVPARVVGGAAGSSSGPAGVGVFLVPPEATELSPHPAATGEPMSRVALTGVRVGADALVGGVADGAAWTTLRRTAVAGAVATVSGVVEGALELTTGYVKGREQFDRTLAQFQAVTMQIGDVYIAKRALDVGVWAGVWRLDEGVPDVDEVLTVAAYNACDPAMKALYTCQHLHGGIGLDVTYPLHRYFAWAKHYGHLLGGAEAQLDALGSLVEA